MNEQIKFRYGYTDGKDWIFKIFTLTDIENGAAYETMSDNPLLRKYKLTTRDRFTGPTDKNGKEVYEGDVLRSPAKDQWEENNYSCFEVFFHDGDANTDYNIGYSMNRMYNHGSVCGGYIPSFKPKTVRNMVIIGNIHDNPELLTDKK